MRAQPFRVFAARATLRTQISKQGVYVWLGLRAFVRARYVCEPRRWGVGEGIRCRANFLIIASVSTSMLLGCLFECLFALLAVFNSAAAAKHGTNSNHQVYDENMIYVTCVSVL